MKQRLSPFLTGSIFILISAMVYGSYGAFSKFLAGYDVLFQTYVRSFLVLTFLGIGGVYTRQFRKIDRHDFFWFAVVLIFTMFSIAPVVYAFRVLSLSNVSFLTFSSIIIFSYLFGMIFFHEKLTKVKIASLLLSFLGLCLVFSVNFQLTLILPIFLTVLTGFAVAGESVFSKKISGKYSSTQISFLTFVAIGVSHAILSLVIGEHQNIEILTKSLPILLLFTVFAIIGAISVVEGFKRVEPSVGSIISLTEILFSVAFGILLFHEGLSPLAAVGGVCIFAAASLPNISELLAARKKSSKI